MDRALSPVSLSQLGAGVGTVGLGVSPPQATAQPQIASFRNLVSREGFLPQKAYSQQQPPSAVAAAAGAAGGPTSSGARLVEVAGLERGRVQLEGVFLNNVCSLKKLQLRNLSERESVVVRLGSTLGDQIRWQLRNDNLDQFPAELRHLATNTVSSLARLDGLPDSNALFDAVGLVSQVTLQPAETRDIILGFRPDVAHFQPATVGNSTLPANNGSLQVDGGPGISEQGLSSISIADSSHSSISQPQPVPSNHQLTSIDGYLNLDASIVVREDALELGGSSSPGSSPQLEGENGTQQLTRVQQLSIEFHATCCKSFFTLAGRGSDKPSDELFVDFGNQCRVGDSPTRECEIVNKSAVELFWRVEDLVAPFTLEDTDTGQLIGPGSVATVPPYSSRRVRFTFKPVEVHEFDCEIVLENVGDPDNIAHIHLHAIVTSAPVENTLLLKSDSALDFGDCCAGEWSQQLFGFTNISGAPLEVSFSAEKGLEVTFRLEIGDKTELLDLDGAAIGANAVEAPPAPADKEAQAARREAPPSGASRTIIHELARNTTAARSNPVGPSPRLLQSDKAFGSSDGHTVGTDSSAPPSVSDAASSAPRTYLPPPPAPVRDLRSPLGTSAALSAADSSDPPASGAGSESREGSSLNGLLARPGLNTRTDSENGLYRVADHLKMVEQRQSTNVDQIYTKPGVPYRIIVSFRPARASSLEGDGGKLSKKTFKIHVSHRPWGSRAIAGDHQRAKERKSIVCKARVCTSFIAVRPDTIDFGEVELGAAVHGTLSITNLSEITARVDLRFISKVLSAYRDEMEIEPGSTIDVRVDFIPRRTNPSYAKQISCHNLRNPHDSAVCLVKAVNVDTRGMAFHSMFYRLLTPTGGNFADFGSVPLNSAAWRAITIQNTSKDNLTLELATVHPEDYQLFLRKSEPVQAEAGDKIVEINGALTAPCTPPKSGRSEAQAKGELRERVLDAMLQPASTAHVPSAPSSSSSSKAAQESVLNGLKEGLKGQPTLAYGSTMGFKDKTLLLTAEYLDLATGPPSKKTVSPKTKRTLFLDPADRLPRHKPSKLSFQVKPIPALGSILGAVEGESKPRPRKPSPPPPTPATPTKQRKPSRRQDGSSAGGSGSSSSPALTARRKTRNVALPTDPSKLSLDQALTALENHAAHPDSSELTTWQAEDAYVRHFIGLRKVLKNAVAAGELFEASLVEVPPEGERTIYILVHPTGARINIGGTSRKQEGTISIKLAKFGAPTNGVVIPPQLSAEIPTREVVLRWTTCRLMLDLGMAHINFGQMEKSSSKTKKIVLANQSDKALLYAVRKSGSIASGDLKLPGGRHGVIEGYGKREVSVIFEPHFAGTFEETIHVDTVEDEQEGQSVRVKAYITKPPTFAVSADELDYAACALETQTTRTLSVTNLSSSKRTFTVSIADKDFVGTRTHVQVILDPSSTNLALPNLTPEEEEEVEGVLQKLKISRRKGQPEKEEKYIARLNLLGVPIPPADSTATLPASPVDASATTKTPPGADAVGAALGAAPLLALPQPSIPLPVVTAPTPTTEHGPAAATAAAAAANGATLAPANANTSPLSLRSNASASPVMASTAKKQSKSSVTFTLEPHSRRDLAVVVRPCLPLSREGEGSAEEAEGGTWEEEIKGILWVTENADSRSAVQMKVLVSEPAKRPAPAPAAAAAA